MMTQKEVLTATMRCDFRFAAVCVGLLLDDAVGITAATESNPAVVSHASSHFWAVHIFGLVRATSPKSLYAGDACVCIALYMRREFTCRTTFHVANGERANESVRAAALERKLSCSLHGISGRNIRDSRLMPHQTTIPSSSGT